MNLFAYLNFGILFLLIKSKIAFSEGNDYEKIEGILKQNLDAIQTQLRNLLFTFKFKDEIISTSCFQNEILNNKMELIKQETINLHNTLKEMEISISTLFFHKDILNANHNSLDLKLEEVISEIKDLRKISEKNSHKTSSTNEPYTFFGNMSNLKAIDGFEINSTGREVTCHDTSKSILSFVKTFVNINVSHYEDLYKNSKNCWTNFPQTMEGHTYFVTPKMKQEMAVKYCEDEGGKPFIPQTLEEFIYYIAMTVEPQTEKYSWYPINDIKTEGNVVLQDGTDYEKANYKPQKWAQKWLNSKEADCVTVDISGECSWSRCYHYDFVLLCQKKINLIS